MGQPQHKLLTAEDYFLSPDETRWELIDGVAWDMAAAPVILHQLVSSRVEVTLSNRMEALGKRRTDDGEPPLHCVLLHAPVDVRLGDITVVQPDVVIVCDPAKLANGKYVNGAPDMVMEVLSASTAKKDRRIKLRLYQSAGVPEYLILDPYGKTVERYLLESGQYVMPPETLGAEDEIELKVLPGVRIALTDWFLED
ncbi:MAG: Uma2 family endonuclease [Pseudomonadota bacterium]|nr:Uma2 family endonuclease [Pseudomonadota bacterium]MDP1905213.1 Uma2 family endonuclease [Pseudomonadota bacterium]MDP2352775.1 Uma2 family endonuclease [Pseudomonadota bacterium]